MFGRNRRHAAINLLSLNYTVLLMPSVLPALEQATRTQPCVSDCTTPPLSPPTLGQHALSIYSCNRRSRVTGTNLAPAAALHVPGVLTALG